MIVHEMALFIKRAGRVFCWAVNNFKYLNNFIIDRVTWECCHFYMTFYYYFTHNDLFNSKLANYSRMQHFLSFSLFFYRSLSLCWLWVMCLAFLFNARPETLISSTDCCHVFRPWHKTLRRRRRRQTDGMHDLYALIYVAIPRVSPTHNPLVCLFWVPF